MTNLVANSGSLSGQTVSMLLADARLPSGGHAYSSGLEPALHGGLPASAVLDYLLARARTVAMVDAGTAVVARRAVLDGRPLHEVATAWAARTPSQAMRGASFTLGRGLLRLAQNVWPTAAEFAAAGALDVLIGVNGGVARPLVLGAISALTGISSHELVRLTVYDDIAAAVAALLKLEPRDPASGVSLVLEACSSVEHEVELVAAISTCEDIPAYSSPEAEAWAELHALSARRLFRG